MDTQRHRDRKIISQNECIRKVIFQNEFEELIILWDDFSVSVSLRIQIVIWFVRYEFPYHRKRQSSACFISSSNSFENVMRFEWWDHITSHNTQYTSHTTHTTQHTHTTHHHSPHTRHLLARLMALCDSFYQLFKFICDTTSHSTQHTAHTTTHHTLDTYSSDWWHVVTRFISSSNSLATSHHTRQHTTHNTQHTAHSTQHTAHTAHSTPASQTDGNLWLFA